MFDILALSCSSSYLLMEISVAAGLEVPCVVTVRVLGTVANNKTLGKYAEFVNILYKGPVKSLF